MAQNGFRVAYRPARRIVGVHGARFDVFAAEPVVGASQDAETIEATPLASEEAEAIVARADGASRPARLPTIRPSFHDLPPLPPVDDAFTTDAIERADVLPQAGARRAGSAHLSWTLAAFFSGVVALSAVAVADLLLLHDFAAPLPAAALARAQPRASSRTRVSARDAAREIRRQSLRRPIAPIFGP